MLKKILKLENLLLFVAFVFPIAISFIISLLNRNLPQLNFYIYFEKCLSVVKQNMGYYGTVFGLFLAMKKYSEDKEQSEKNREEREKDREERKQEREEKLLEKQQEREKELIRIQEESNLLREKEIENRKDNYRPTFIIYNNKIELLMRKDELFLENIKYYPCKSGNYDEEGEFIGVKKSGEYIIEGTEEDPIPDNFYISADTILGEKILFGFLFGNNKIYKSLNENGNPLMPRGNLQEKYILSEINKNWTGYNFTNINEELEKQFFYNSQGIRENLYLGDSSNVYIKEILESKNHKELYNNLFDNLTDWYSKPKKFTDNSIIEVINAVYNQVYYNADLFKMSNINIRVDYVIKIIQALENKVELKNEKDLIELTKKLKNCFKEQNFENIKLILDCINKIVGYAKNLPNESNEKYRVLECCLKILKEFFKNVEEEKENNKLLQNNFLSNKSEILNKIEFEEE